GGLASTLIAMIARNRCELDCVVAGVDGSSDVVAAKAAKSHLDYRIEVVILRREDAMRIRARIEASHPGLRPRDIDNLVPLHAALERSEVRPMLAGFGVPRPASTMVAALRRAGVVWPLRTIAPQGSDHRGGRPRHSDSKIGRAHVSTPVTFRPRTPDSAS